jgi:Rhodopsin-like GPCR transmembrane domain
MKTPTIGFLAWCLWLPVLLLPRWTNGKTTSGRFRLSGLNTEYVLGSFAVSPNKMGSLKVTFKSKEPYQMNKDLFVRLYRDDKWGDYQKAPSCTEKIPFSITNEQVTSRKKQNHYEAEVSMQLNNHKDDQSHYFYFVITDCSLEFYMHDASIPQMSFTLQAWNDGSHVSAAESHLKNMHTITLILSGILAIALALAIFVQIYERATVHSAMFWVMAAAGCDSLASLFELIHLSLYAHNGVGNYFLDAVSAHLEAMCDSLVALLLLSVAAGWTLPSDVIAVQHNATPVQRLLGGLQSPFAALTSFNSSAVLAISILLSHVILAQWGRMMNDDFDSYHDLEHLPGKILMLWRIVLGLGMLTCCFSTRMRCPPSLQGFYLQLAIVGTLWFQSLPVLTWIVNTAIPYTARHRTVGVWGAVLQTAGIVLLSWLVTSHSTPYHKFSHLSTTQENLTDSLVNSTAAGGASDAPRTWKFGKAKVRLD